MRDLDNMTCYTRHLDMIFQKAGVEKSFPNKQILDKVIRDILNEEEEKKGFGACAEIFKIVRQRLFVEKDKELEDKIVKRLVKEMIMG